MANEEKNDSTAEEKHEGRPPNSKKKSPTPNKKSKNELTPGAKETRKSAKKKLNTPKPSEKPNAKPTKKKKSHKQANGGEAAQKRGSPQHSTRSSITHGASRFAEGTRRTSEKALFRNSSTLTGGGGYFDMFAPPKKKPAPVRTTVINPRTGKVTVTEPVTQEKKKPAQMQGWNPMAFENLISPELHTPHFETHSTYKLTQPRRSKGKGKSKRAWNLGDLI